MTPLLANWSFVPEGIDDPWRFFALAAGAMVLMAMAKAGFAGSVGLLSVPMMIHACGGDALLANGIILPLLILCDWVSLASWWRQWNARLVLRLLPGTLAGVGVAWALLWAVQATGAKAEEKLVNAALMMGIGAIALGFVVLQLIRSFRKKPRVARPGPIAATAVGLAAGATSTFAHAAGPITSMYMLAHNMPKGRFVATSVLFYWVPNHAKLLPYFHLGLVDLRSLAASAALVPAVVAGALLGLFLHRRVGQKQFNGIVYVLLALAGGHLCYEAGKVLWARMCGAG